MTERFLKFMPWLLSWEGSDYENDPDDPGGETKYGIDKRSHPNEDIRNLTEGRAREIYWTEYWQKMRCDELPPKVGEVVMNIGVNAGIRRAARWLQHACGAYEDGVIGKDTIAMAKAWGTPALTDALLERTEAHYRSIAKGKLAKFLKGWINRNDSLRKLIA